MLKCAIFSEIDYDNREQLELAICDWLKEFNVEVISSSSVLERYKDKGHDPDYILVITIFYKENA